MRMPAFLFISIAACRRQALNDRGNRYGYLVIPDCLRQAGREQAAEAYICLPQAGWLIPFMPALRE